MWHSPLYFLSFTLSIFKISNFCLNINKSVVFACFSLGKSKIIINFAVAV